MAPACFRLCCRRRNAERQEIRRLQKRATAKSPRLEEQRIFGGSMRFTSRVCTIGFVAAALSLGSFAGLQTAAATALKVMKFGSVGGMTDAPIYLADEAGLFAKAGLK